MDTRIPLLSLLIASSLVMDGAAQNRFTSRHYSTRSETIARHAMAATSQPLATQVALEILRKGGNAIDAAIAANAMTGLVEPTGSGIGGDLFAIVWHAKSKKLFGLNGSGRSPKSLSLEKLRELCPPGRDGRRKIPALGALPVSVPGCVDGWFSLHERFGKLPMRELLAPTIRYAKEGFPLTEVIAYYWRGNARSLRRFDGFAETYLPGGRAPKKGEVFRNPRLARTLERIAEGGRKAFYEGEIAKTIADTVQAQGGYLSTQDLASHHSEWVDPLSTDYRGYTVWELPPNGQGIAALQILNLLEPYELSSYGFGSARYLHVFLEAKKLAFEDRARFYADPAFAKLPIRTLISKAYAAERRKLIQEDRAAAAYPASHPSLEDGDTIYLTVADKDRNMVSLIQSNYRGMGSGVIPKDLGFILQDRGELFDLEPGRPNSYAPGKRPFHTIIPAFVTKDGKPYLSFGVMGGAMQPQGHAQILVNLIDFGMNLQEAGDAPRVRHSGSSQPTGERMKNGGRVSVENGFDTDVLEALRKMGHRVRRGRGGFGGYQAILYDAKNDVYIGASESRKDGMAAGY